MKIKIDINDDLFDEVFRAQLVEHYFMVNSDLKRTPHPEDLKWMRPVKDALYTLITMYYSTQSQRAEFLEQVKEDEDGSSAD